ncbi:hypothetical protein HDU67_010317, partial [Dinochytrium kinnereticum]
RQNSEYLDTCDLRTDQEQQFGEVNEESAGVNDGVGRSAEQILALMGKGKRCMSEKRDTLTSAVI